MAILKSVIPVNNGNTGWSNKDVLDALETAFSQLGFHGGSIISGAPQACQSPGSYEILKPESAYNHGYTGVTSTWKRNGGATVSPAPWINRYFYVTNNGTSDYRILEEFVFDATSSTIVNLTNNTIFIGRNGLVTGDAVTWTPGVTNSNLNIGGLTLNTVYYIIVTDSSRIKLAANVEDANAGTAIDLTSVAAAYGGRLRRVDSATYANYTINVFQGDRLNFTVNDSGSGGTFNLCGQVDSYTQNRKLDASFFSSITYMDQPTGNGTTSVVWDTAGWRQSESEPISPITHPADDQSWSYTRGTVKYIYANSTVSAMKGEIVVLPRVHNDSSLYKPYWKYTVPASGGRSELKLRVWRYPTAWDAGVLAGVTIHSIGSGWTNTAIGSGDTFTIPGDSIGGFSPANDIRFGVNTNETASGAGNGIASIAVTTLGAGSNFFQKHNDGLYAILKNVNDASKAYGTTYYSFATRDNNNYQIIINSGSGWDWLNHGGTSAFIFSYTNASSLPEAGSFAGYSGLDKQSSYNYIYRGNDTDFGQPIQIASSATPTAYPLSIRTYRAQAPQDANFAIIQFTQTINGVIVPYGTFTIHKGATFGSSVFSLDHVYLDSFTVYSTGSRSISTSYRMPGYRYNGLQQEAPSPNTKARAATYGWFRDSSDSAGNYSGSVTNYTCNIDTGEDGDVTIYYRNSTYDQYAGRSVSSSANYYKPIKGIPIDNRIVPCPYYIPDDFVMLQVSTTPGLVAFRPGDTVTISASEVYEIILAGWENNQNGLDNINNNSTIGMLFMARTT